MLGSRYVAGGGVRDWGPVRRIVSRAGCLVRAGGARPARSDDLTGGFKCFRREVLEAIDLAHARSHGYVFQIELTYRALQAGFRVREVPITFRDRADGPLEDVVGDRAGGRSLLVPRLRLGRRGRALGAQMRALSDMR